MFVPVVMTNLSVLFVIYYRAGRPGFCNEAENSGDGWLVHYPFCRMTFSTRMALKPLASLENRWESFRGSLHLSERLPTDLSTISHLVVGDERAIGSFQEFCPN